MLEDFEQAHGIASIALRRFNAAGRDPDGELGERHEPETHAIPSAIAAAPNNESFTVLGTDFDTPDGSAVRDYVHVSDLAHGHVLAAERLLTMEGTEVLNFGTGQGTSVLEVGAAVRQAAGVDFDVEMLVASAERARNLLCWVPTRSSIDSIVESALEWQRTSAQTSRA
jgi:UDP-arabinose 4-epimerase